MVTEAIKISVGMLNKFEFTVKYSCRSFKKILRHLVGTGQLYTKNSIFRFVLTVLRHELLALGLA